MPGEPCLYCSLCDLCCRPVKKPIPIQRGGWRWMGALGSGLRFPALQQRQQIGLIYAFCISTRCGLQRWRSSCGGGSRWGANRIPESPLLCRMIRNYPTSTWCGSRRWQGSLGCGLRLLALKQRQERGAWHHAVARGCRPLVPRGGRRGCICAGLVHASKVLLRQPEELLGCSQTAMDLQRQI